MPFKCKQICGVACFQRTLQRPNCGDSRATSACNDAEQFRRRPVIVIKDSAAESIERFNNPPPARIRVSEPPDGASVAPPNRELPMQPFIAPRPDQPAVYAIGIADVV